MLKQTGPLDRRAAIAALPAVALACTDPAGPGAPRTITADVGTLTAGTISGGSLTIDLDASGTDPVLSHSNFTLRADGSAEFSGTVSASNFTASLAAFSGFIRVGGDPSAGNAATDILDDAITFYQTGDGGSTTSRIRKVAADSYLSVRGDDGTQIETSSTGKVGFLGKTPISKPTVSGSAGGNAALESLLTALANYGLITDSST